jgi:hypothetical protein
MEFNFPRHAENQPTGGTANLPYPLTIHTCIMPNGLPLDVWQNIISYVFGERSKTNLLTVCHWWKVTNTSSCL